MSSDVPAVSLAQRSSVDMRQLAEERTLNAIRKKSVLAINENIIVSSNLQRRYSSTSTAAAEAQILNNISKGIQPNLTPDVAKLNMIDFELNSSRCRADSDDFVGPRWVLDQEFANCNLCRSEFTILNRRHHCRFCGQIFCQVCSSKFMLLPKDFGMRDPQRVCTMCQDVLQPLQMGLTNDIANHLRTNSVDVVSGKCNVRRHFNLPFSLTLGSEIRKAAYSIYNLVGTTILNDKGIPLNLILNSKGLAFLTVVKGGFIIAPKFGTGLVIARLPDGTWSAPSAIGLVGCNYGPLVGGDLTDHIVILNTTEAVQAFSGRGQLSIGAGVEVAIGPLGRSGLAGVSMGSKGIAAAVSYSHSKGLFAGVSLDGSIIVARSDVNHKFYGREISPSQILGGRDVQPPRAGAPLYDALDYVMASLPNPSYDRNL